MKFSVLKTISPRFYRIYSRMIYLPEGSHTLYNWRVVFLCLLLQKELFASKDGGGAEGRERKMSNSSGGSMKTKWMKAFKSLKTSEPTSGKWVFLRRRLLLTCLLAITSYQLTYNAIFMTLLLTLCWITLTLL